MKQGRKYGRFRPSTYLGNTSTNLVELLDQNRETGLPTCVVLNDKVERGIAGSTLKKRPRRGRRGLFLKCDWRAGCPRSKLGSGFPARHVFEHLRRKNVHLDAHGVELEGSDLLVDFLRQDVDAGG